MTGKTGKRLVVSLLCLGLLFGMLPLAGTASLAEPTTPDVTIAQTSSPYYAHFPDIINVPASAYASGTSNPYPNGKLLVGYYKNTTHAPSSASQPFGTIELVESTDDGLTWSQPREVISSAKLIEYGIGSASVPIEARDPNFALLNDGTLLLTFFTRRYGSDNNIHVYVMESVDGGTSWAAPVLIPCASLTSFCAKRGNIAVFEDDQVLIPVYGAPASAPNNQTAVNILATRTGPSTWTWNAEYKLADSSSLGATINEVSLVSPGGNKVYALAREPGYLWESNNRGATWTKVASFGLMHQPGLILMPDGNIFATWTRVPGGPRPVYGKMLYPNLGWDVSSERLIYQYTGGGASDMGDPSAVLTNDGRLLTVYYVTGLRAIAGTFSNPSDWYPAEMNPDMPRGTIFADDFQDDTAGENYNNSYFTSYSRNSTNMTIKTVQENGNNILRFFSKYEGGYKFPQMFSSELLGNDLTAQLNFRFNGDKPTTGAGIQELYLSTQYINGTGVLLQLQNDALYLKHSGITLKSVPLTPLTTGQWYTLKMLRLGRTFYIKIWPAATAEPAQWLTTYTYTADIVPGNLRIGYLTADTNGQSLDIDQIKITKALETEIAPATLSRIIGATPVQLTLEAYPAQSSPSIRWSSSNASVASVAADGTVSFLAKGSATITASMYGVSATCQVTVTEQAYELSKLGDEWKFLSEDFSTSTPNSAFSSSLFNVYSGTNYTLTAKEESGNRFLQYFSKYIASYNQPQIISKTAISGNYTARFDFRFGSATASGELQEAYLGMQQNAGVYLFHLRSDGIAFKDSRGIELVSMQKAHTPGQWFSVRISRGENGLYIRTWPKGTQEPDSWDLMYAADGIGTTGNFRIGYVSRNTAGQTFDIDGISLSRRSSITLNRTSVSAQALSQPVQLDVSYTPGLESLSPAPTEVWTSSNSAVASVSATGLLSFRAAGTATITVTIGNVVRTCVVTVS